MPLQVFLSRISIFFCHFRDIFAKPPCKGLFPKSGLFFAEQSPVVTGPPVYGVVGASVVVGGGESATSAKLFEKHLVRS